MFERDDFAALLKQAAFRPNDTDQCMFGGASQNPSTLLSLGYGGEVRPPADMALGQTGSWQD